LAQFHATHDGVPLLLQAVQQNAIATANVQHARTLGHGIDDDLMIGAGRGGV
jgi:hypothetical protein